MDFHSRKMITFPSLLIKMEQLTLFSGIQLRNGFTTTCGFTFVHSKYIYMIVILSLNCQPPLIIVARVVVLVLVLITPKAISVLQLLRCGHVECTHTIILIHNLYYKCSIVPRKILHSNFNVLHLT